MVHCPHCEQVVSSQSSEQIVESILTFPERTKIMLLAPVWREVSNSKLGQLFDKLVSEGYVRSSEWPIARPTQVDDVEFASQHTVEIVIDRLIMKDGIQSRLQESVNTTLKRGDGECIVTVQAESGEWIDHFFNEKFACSSCDISFPNIHPATLNSNSPQGACPECDGLGYLISEDENTKTIDEADHLCVACNGARINPLARNITVDGANHFPICSD
ncbi:MAG: hypothetical protein R3C11_05375 [Planctomycetaceae bacterium]